MPLHIFDLSVLLAAAAEETEPSRKKMAAQFRKIFFMQSTPNTFVPIIQRLYRIKLADCLSRSSRCTFERFYCSKAVNGSRSGLESVPHVKDQRLLKVAVIGEPNSGKSTLTNVLVGEKICAVTDVPHTTRQQTVGVFCEGNSQIILLDTPGIVKVDEGRRLRMSRQHMTAPENALLEADLIAVLHDAALKKRRNRIHEEILHALQHHKDVASILLLNKVDILKHKTELLKLAAILTEDREKDQWGYKEIGGWSRFDNIFMISARNGDGIQDIKKYFAAKAKPSGWIYSADVHTDQSLDARIKDVFREIFLKLYDHEIPWQINQVTVLCELKNNGQQRIHQKLYCRKKSQRRCVLEKIDILSGTAVSELENLFGCPVDLSVDVAVRGKPIESMPKDDHFFGIL